MQIFLVGAMLLGALWAVAQQIPVVVDEEESSPIPGFTQEQTERLLKDSHKKAVEDAAALVKLSNELKSQLEKQNYSVVSMSAVKKTEEIEKLAKRIRGRIQRF